MASGASIACRRTLRSFHERERNSHWDGVAEEEATSNEATEDIPHQVRIVSHIRLVDFQDLQSISTERCA
jgi:hypothetical protein